MSKELEFKEVKQKDLAGLYFHAETKDYTLVDKKGKVYTVPNRTGKLFMALIKSEVERAFKEILPKAGTAIPMYNINSQQELLNYIKQRQQDYLKKL